MIRLPSYLQLNRNGIFYFRIRLSHSLRIQLGVREIKRSLKYSNRKQAIQIAHDFKNSLDRILLLIQAKRMNWTETKKLLDRVLHDIMERYKERIEKEGPWGDTNGGLRYDEGFAELEAGTFLELRKTGADYFEDNDFATDKIVFRNFTGHMSSVVEVRKIANRIIGDYEIQVPEDQYENFCLQVSEMLEKLHDIRWEYLHQMRGGVEEVLPLSSVLVGLDEKQTRQNSNAPSISLKEVFNKLYHEKTTQGESWRERTASQMMRNFEKLHEIIEYWVGFTNINIGDISRHHATKLKETLTQLPRDSKKKYPHLSIEELLKIKDQKLISVRTQNNYLNLMSNIFEYAQNNHYVQDNPFKGLQIKISKKKRKKQEYKRFTDSELENLFNSDIFIKKKFSKSYHFWLPLMALYSGARIEELCQLHLTDITDISGTPVIIIQEEEGVKTTKTDASNRIIPIHSTLIRIGLIDYVNSLKNKGKTLLFTDLKPFKNRFSHYASRWFNEDSKIKISYKTKCGIKGQGKVFHSFRKTFVDNLKQIGEEERMVAAIVGHEKNTMTFGNYANPYNINLLKTVVDKLDFPNANLPWDVEQSYKF